MEINGNKNDIDLVLNAKAHLDILLEKDGDGAETILESIAESVKDSASLESFADLKTQVANAHQAGRAEYVANLKKAVESGEYQVDSSKIAGAMVRDGFLSLLT